MFDAWLKHLSLKQRAQAFYGTVKRVFKKGLRERLVVEPYEPAPRQSAAAAETEKQGSGSA